MRKLRFLAMVLSLALVLSALSGLTVFATGVSGDLQGGEENPDGSHTHNYVPAVTKPTCTEKGYTTYTCSCGDSYKDNYVAALGHNYVPAVTPPTCTEGGYTTYTCSRCKDSYVADETDALGHTPGEWETDDAYHWYICTKCGEEFEKAEHSESDWIIDTPASAGVEGSQHKECTVCGKILAQEPIPAPAERVKGDINGDGKVNNKDLVRLFQYLSKWDVDVVEESLDINGDTKVNNKDLVRLFQYLSKWEVEIF